MDAIGCNGVVKIKSFCLQLSQLSKQAYSGQLSVSEVYSALGQLASRSFDVPRVSFWIRGHDEGGEHIVCLDLFELETQKQTRGMKLYKKDYPSYFEYMEENTFLNARDARTHPRTMDFAQGYLEPLEIFSLLDAPFHYEGRVEGIICFEATKKHRDWSTEDEGAQVLMSNFMTGYITTQRYEENLRASHQLLDEQRAKMIHASRLSALGEMAGGVAHEINNPLSVIQGKAYQILRRLEKPDPDLVKIKEDVQKIDSTVGRISKIISGLRAFSGNTQSEESVTTSARKIVDETLDLCQERMKSRGIRLEVEVEDGLQFQCRPTQIGQVLLNLLNNSVDALQDSEGGLISVRARREGCYARFTVSDSGPGISSEIRDKIMQPFFTTKPIGKGTGLGLSISRGLVEEQNGRLWLDEKDKNTSFHFELPLVPLSKS